MLTREQVIELLRRQSAYLAQEYGIRRLGLFGSFAKGQSHDESDVDMVVEFDRPIGLRFVELAEYLETLLGRKVDLLTPTGIQGIRRGDISRDISESVLYV